MLTVLGLKEAQDLLLMHFQAQLNKKPRQTVYVPLQAAIGRVLSTDLIASANVPAFDRSQVDGFAVRATDTFGVSESVPAQLRLIGEVAMGQTTTLVIQPGECAYVPTGGMIPPGADAMVMIEHTESFDPTLRLLSQRVAPGQSVTHVGDDCHQGQILLPAGHSIRSADLGALAALGLAQIEVFSQIHVGILSTGDELIDIDQVSQIAPGQIIDVNRPMLLAAAKKLGARVLDYKIVPDQLDLLQTKLQQAVRENDLVLISGGSSAGARDYVEQAMNLAGKPGVILHGIAVKPGKPTLAGNCDGTMVIGLPGHPVAAWFMFDQLTRPLIETWSGKPIQIKPSISARLTTRIPSNHGREEFVLVRLRSDDLDPLKVLAEPLATRSGLVTQLTAGDGYLRIPRDREGLEAGSLVEIFTMTV